MKYGIGIDLGGNRLKSAIVMENREIIKTHIINTNETPSQWTACIHNRIQEFTKEMKSSPSWIGLAAPGLTDYQKTHIAHMPGRLHGLEGLNWAESLNSSVDIQILNDAHAALYGEICIGAAKGSKQATLITLGTGVGGAAIVDGHLLHGNIGRAGHLGHISVNIHGSPDICNMPGSLEDAIGEASVKKRTNGYVSSTKELVERFKAGESEAEQYWLTSVHTLACAIAGIINILDPEFIIIGGGISEAGESLFGPLKDYVNSYEWQPAGHKVRIIPAQLKEFSGAIGVCCFAQDYNSRYHHE